MNEGVEEQKRKKKRRVFEVAKELKVVTPTVIDFLEKQGYDVSRKQMHPVSEEMYVVLLHKFDRRSYNNYQSEHSTTREAVQKRDADRLRKEEQEQLLAVKDVVREPKKIALPSYREFILEDTPPAKLPEEAPTQETINKPEAPAVVLTSSERPEQEQDSIVKDPEVSVDSRITSVEAKPEFTQKTVTEESLEKKIVTESPAKIESDITIAAKGAEESATIPKVLPEKKDETVINKNASKIVIDTDTMPLPVEVVVQPEEQKAKEIVSAPKPRKIELPKLQSLKIIEQAPKKVVPEVVEEAKPKRKKKRVRKKNKTGIQAPGTDVKTADGSATSAAPHADSAPSGTEETKPAVAAKSDDKTPKADATGDSKPKKRKLKRKRITLAVETATDAIEEEAETKLQRDIEKQSKQNPASKKDAGITTKAPRKRKRKKTNETAPVKLDSKLATRSKKKKKVSATEVAATIKETMAKVEGRGKGKRRHIHSKESEIFVDEKAKLRVTEFITTQELANLLEIQFQEIITRCLSLGMIISINQRLDRDVIELLASEFDAEVEFVQDEEIEDEDTDESIENQVKRPPVVTIMGHVDHGKTTLLDYLRRTRVAEGEVGGITQHIGAYEVLYKGQRITFLDTPGHEAFTAMRARGAQITDIVVLVVAADDRVMPQTVEAIDHAKAAGTPIVVAVNKMDKPQANSDAIYKQLADHNILVEKWGGNYQTAEISAKFGQGTEDLLTEILVSADMLELTADPTARARGVVVESRLDKGLGAVATILVQSGTLNLGDPIVVGENYGRVRAMYNEIGEKRPNAGPATPVQVVGFNGVPQAGDQMVVYRSEKEARDVSQRRQRQHREISARKIHALTLEQASKQLQEAQLKELPLLIKGDVHGSVEVLSDALMKLSTSEVKVEIIHRGVGGITESDALLAAASGAIIIGFHVHPNVQARELARKEGVEIRLYRIIHEVVDEIRASLEGLLAPLKEERILGSVEIRQVFKISRLGTIGGGYVREGKIARNNRVRLIRDDIEIWTGDLSSLKRFKDDAREVLSGFECGIALDGFRDLREGDRIEVFEIFETKRKLDAQAGY